MTTLSIILSLIIGAFIGGYVVIAWGLYQGGRYTPKDSEYKDDDE